jgi:hypothetical protein
VKRSSSTDGSHGERGASAAPDTKSTNCHWCSRIEAAGVIASEQGYVIFTDGDDAGPQFTLVPRSHAGTLNQLPSFEKTTILAGLTTMTSSLRRSHPMLDVEIQAIPAAGGNEEHVRFAVSLTEPLEETEALDETEPLEDGEDPPGLSASGEALFGRQSSQVLHATAPGGTDAADGHVQQL